MASQGVPHPALRPVGGDEPGMGSSLTSHQLLTFRDLLRRVDPADLTSSDLSALANLINWKPRGGSACGW